jgi:hypothetical protein
VCVVTLEVDLRQRQVYQSLSLIGDLKTGMWKQLKSGERIKWGGKKMKKEEKKNCIKRRMPVAQVALG